MIFLYVVLAYVMLGFLVALLGWKLGGVRANETEFALTWFLWPLFVLFLVFDLPYKAYSRFIRFLSDR